MKRHFTTLVLFAWSAVAGAQTATPFTMWVAEGTSNSVYLLGSVHLLRPGDYPLPSVVDRAYADAESLIMELDMDDLDPLAMQGLVNRLGLLPPGRTLADELGEDAYAEASSIAADLDVPLELLARSEPWLAAITVEQLVLTRLGFDPAYGVEMKFLRQAQQDGKSITGFETVEEQLKFLDNLSPAAQRDMLMQTLSEGTEIETLMDAMISAWRSGDVKFLETNMLEQLEAFPELYRAIVADRNERWLQQLAPLFDETDDYLVIVGALHLIGDDGLPERLRSKGVTVRQLQTDSPLPVD